jgi:nicotinamide mononucleotide transporter
MTWTEILGFVTGAASVLLAVRESAGNWPVGIANNIFFLILFWKAKLYADAILQIVYIVTSFFGWWNWVCGGAGHTELPISKTTVRAGIALGSVTIVASVILTIALHRFTDSTVPLGDSVLRPLSV